MAEGVKKEWTILAYYVTTIIACLKRIKLVSGATAKDEQCQQKQY